ncbi:MAG: imidazole glycerol phosphate synthase subunit HisF [Verrucomicrobia bacterium]|nr:imidazole glycerol phosphate synthase subunit HisF [Verrucomicrobiota bacterium]MCG2681862.1 HisA/HisF-related TIM barrel protein [Kiritimatiellia bacterium]MBU4247742.1 imidazole glycerol phosphate synthase subunit HisF [Verrucomicrobiota bacterium]MBU4291606.1 imidazole glycerol phosphate synthase subunit HisF [Verrucomicrobiota bacterium]MBU4428596.1 imidazole glycerol phosphate synthase subunit HisF [Verrucomicrobiota bacterium]
MPKNVRIIPRLDIKGPNLIKGIHLEGLRVLGKPHQFARHYYENGADELFYMDIVASLYNRNSMHDIIRQTAQEICIPLTVGGGLRCIEDIRDVLRAGADKVALNTAAIANEMLIKESAEKFGSSTILISIEAIKQPDGRYLAYTDNGREYTGKEVLAWAHRAEELGAGEILITSVDREGPGKGYDIDLTKMMARTVSIPVIACGGAGNANDVIQVINQGRADAVSLASILHYDFVATHEVDIDTSVEGNPEFIKKNRTISTITPLSLSTLKNIFAVQFHPEKSAQEGIKIYKTWAQQIGNVKKDCVTESSWVCSKPVW